LPIFQTIKQTFDQKVLIFSEGNATLSRLLQGYWLMSDVMFHHNHQNLKFDRKNSCCYWYHKNVFTQSSSM